MSGWQSVPFLKRRFPDHEVSCNPRGRYGRRAPRGARGKTPLEYAETPNMDTIAREGACGMLRTIPDLCDPGSDIANLSILGYDPVVYYTGRGPLEAVSMGITLANDDIAYRCNLVTVMDDVMIDFSAGHISSIEGRELFDSLEHALPQVRMKAGISYRNLLVIPKGQGAVTFAPHDIVGQPLSGYLPTKRRRSASENVHGDFQGDIFTPSGQPEAEDGREATGDADLAVERRKETISPRFQNEIWPFRRHDLGSRSSKRDCGVCRHGTHQSAGGNRLP